MKITKEQLLHFDDTLVKIRDAYKGQKVVSAKFFYALKRNLDITKNEVFKIRGDLINKYTQSNSDPVAQEYEQKRQAICIDHANKKEDGSPIINEQHNYDIPQEKMEAFRAKFAELNEEYKEYITKRSEQSKEIENFLQEEIEIKLYTIPVDLLPDNEAILTIEDIESLSPMID